MQPVECFDEMQYQFAALMLILKQLAQQGAGDVVSAQLLSFFFQTSVYMSVFKNIFLLNREMKTRRKVKKTGKCK